jgi:8-oxo-dGTP pyrophosphatase MutT (NUDIX family)
MQDLVMCQTLFGKSVSVPRDSIIERTCAYAFILRGHEVLFLNTKATGKDWLPGGGLEEDETFERALQREIREEVGIEVEILKPLLCLEEWIYYERRCKGYHQHECFFACRTTASHTTDNESSQEHAETDRPHWVSLSTVDLSNLQPTLRALFPRVRADLLHLVEG